MKIYMRFQDIDSKPSHLKRPTDAQQKKNQEASHYDLVHRQDAKAMHRSGELRLHYPQSSDYIIRTVQTGVVMKKLKTFPI